MHILLSNDDGIHAPGIRVLREAASNWGDIDIVAPSEEQSAVGHAITIFDPIRMYKVHEQNEFIGYAVKGTPADCVKLAICELFKEKPPDYLISGINLGANTGIAVLYSGTVSAATEATILGVPSMALSLNTYTDPHWETAGQVAQYLIGKLIEQKLPERTLLNVNIPNRPYDELKGYAVTRMAKSRYVEKFHKRIDPRENEYFWLDGEMEMLEAKSGTDVEAVDKGFVSVTPIGLDLTEYGYMDEMKSWDLEC